MNVQTLIDDLVGHGVELWLDDGRLRVRGPEEAVIPQLYAQLRQRKAEVTSLLAECSGHLDRHPLSYNQQSLWLLHQLAPHSPCYNVNAVIAAAEVDLPLLQGAVDAVVQAHPILRTIYRVEHGRPVQIVLEEAAVSVSCRTVDPWMPDDIDRAVALEVDTPFDLEQATFRVGLLRSPDKHATLIVVTVHHIACDYWSLQILLSQIQAAYRCGSSGWPIKVEPPRNSYIDYARRQRAGLAGEAAQQHWAFWRDNLAGLPDGGELATDRPRPHQQTFDGTTLSVPLVRDLCASLRTACRRHGVTPFMFMLAVFQILLSRYTENTQLAIGLTTSGRDSPGTQDIIGNFVNMLVLRADLAGNPDFATLLVRVRTQVLAAMEHQDYPFYRIVERLGRERDPGRSPLFQIVYNWNQTNPEQFEDSSLGRLVRGSSTGLNGAPYELMLTIASSDDQLTCQWNYNTGLFDASTIEHMSAAYLFLLRAALDRPKTEVAALPLVDASESRRLRALNDARLGPGLPTSCVHELIADRARAAADRIAVVCGTESLTYGELELQSNALARVVQQSGASRSRCVGLYCERSTGMVVGLLGILKSGSTYVPLERGHPTRRLLDIVEDAEIRIVVGQPGPLTDAAALQLVAPGATCGEASGDHVSVVDHDDLAYNIYTSGSTGRPKGVCVEHGSLASFMQAMASAIGMTADDRLLAITTPAFDISLLEMLLPLTVGARVVIAKSELMRSPDALPDVIRDQRISFMQATPSAWQMFLDSNPQTRAELNILCGGEALSARLASRLLAFGGKVWNVYGPTETTIWVGALPVARRTQAPAATDEAEGIAGAAEYVSESIGGPIGNTAWLVLDHKLMPVPIGMPGELCIAGPHVGRGYWKRPDLTEAAFVRNPFDSDRLYRTGDRVRCLPDGRMRFLGRKDRQLKVRGFRIEPSEVEAALCAHPAVQSAVVTARSNRRGECNLVGYVVAAAGEKIPHSEIRLHLRDRLPEYFIPSFLIELDEIPVTVNGKIDYAALPEPDSVRHLAVGEYVVPESKTECWLVEVWADVLGIEPSRIGIDQNFFELGGHSMLLVQVWNRVAPRARQGLALTDLYRYPSIRGLASRIDGGEFADQADDIEARAERRKKGLLGRRAVSR